MEVSLISAKNDRNQASKEEYLMKRGTILSPVLLVSAVLLMGCGINGRPGSGEKIGQVVKLSNQGMFCQTWEGQLIRGGMSGGSGSFGVQPFDFTVEDDELAQKVVKYMQDQTEVIIKYRMEGLYSVCRSDSSGRFLVSIEPAKK